MANVMLLKLFGSFCPKCLQTQLNSSNKRLLRLNSAYRKCSQNLSTSSDRTQEDEEIEGDSPFASDTSMPQYPGHIPTTLLQKTLLSIGSAATAIISPWRGDMVATLGETTGQMALIKMRQKMMEDQVGRQILDERPRINSRTVDLEYLSTLPDDTFGKTYVTWLDKNHASPDERVAVSFVDDPDLAYVMQRYRETHDLYHTALGMPTNMLGEIVVKWVEALQLGLPMCAFGAMFGPVRLGPKHLEMYLQTHLWWALRNGRQATFLLNVYYEKHWESTMDEIRAILNIEPPPKTPERNIQT